MKTIYETSNELIKLSHIDGSLFKIEAINNSLQIQAGQEISLEHIAKVYTASRTDVMPNWYFVGPNNEVSLVENTAGEELSFVSDFTTKEQWKRYPDDEYDPYSPEQRYDVIGFDAPEDVDTPLFIPQPLYVTNLDKAKKMILDNQWKLYTEKGLEKEAHFLKEFFQVYSAASSKDTRQAKHIILRTGDPEVKIQGKQSPGEEAYALTVNTTDQYVEIVGKTAAGVFYGVQTLISLAGEKGAVPRVTIKDAPRFSYRGFHVDVSRNFHPKSVILRLLETMSMYKMNKFHFHLSDDEGWRLEIPGIPELTQVGARRCHDPTGLKCIKVQLGADPSTPTKPYYYTIKDYQEILQFANDRHIQVIPEFDMPGHSYAAIKSMEARYWVYKNKGNLAAAEEFLLTEFNDTSRYTSIQYFNDNTLNPCLESTYKFILHVVKSLKNIHEKYQPLTVYHFGGDETPKGAWKDSPACLKLVGEGEYDTRKDKLKERFFRRVGSIVDSLGLILGGWDDFFPSQEKLIPNKDAIAWSWNDYPGYRGEEKAYRFALAGYKVVLAHASHLYLDHPQEPDPEERGNNWAARFIDTRKVFGYIPNFCKTAGRCDDPKAANNIYGVAGCLWSETVRTADQMAFMIFPRLLSLAERAWHKAPWEDIRNDEESKRQMNEEWKLFSSFIVKNELQRLDKLGIKYRLPPPGIRFDGKSIKVRTALPGLPVQFSKDGGKSWYDITKDTEINSAVIVATSSIDRQRKSRPIQVKPPGNRK